MQVILLERVEKLGNLGDTVNVKPGFARNYLLPQGKALRATKEAIEQFEKQKSAIEKANNEKKTAAEKIAKKIEDKTIVIIRSASDAGQLYGSVTTRDIAGSLTELSGDTITRNNVILETPIKTIGFFDFRIKLHAEVTVNIKINVAQSDEEAQLQADRVARGEPAVITAVEEDAKVAAEIEKAQADEMAEVAKQLEAEEQGVEVSEPETEGEAETEAEEKPAKKAKAKKATAKKAAAKKSDAEETEEKEDESE